MFGHIDHGFTVDAAKPFLERHEELCELRQPMEPLWKRTSEFLNASSSITYPMERNALRAKFRLDMTMQLANNRLAAMLAGLLFSPWTPWLEAYTPFDETTHEEDVYLEKMTQIGHEYLVSPVANWNTSSNESLLDVCGYGNGPIWADEQPRGGLSIKACNLMDVWVDEDELGNLDTAHRIRRFKAINAAKRFPKSDKIADLAGRSPNAEVNILECVQMRLDGVSGGIAARKPYTSMIIDLTHGQAIREGGYNEFPCSYLRFNRSPGGLYAVGPGLSATPTQYTREALLNGTLRNVDMRNDPPIMKPNGMFTQLDRRPLGMTSYDDAFMYKSAGRPQNAVFALPVAGDTGIGVEMLRMLEAQIMQFYFADWMQPGETEGMTATEVLDRRDTRLRMLGPLVARMTQDLTPLAERLFSTLRRQRRLPDPPETLRGKEIRFKLRSPLQQLQQQQTVEEMLRALSAVAKTAELAAGIDPVVRTDELARDIAVKAGTPMAFVRSGDEIAQRRQDEAQSAELEQQADLISRAAPAVAAGAQLTNALGGQ